MLNLSEFKVKPDKCPHLKTKRYFSNLRNLEKLFYSKRDEILIGKSKVKSEPKDGTRESIVGVIDGINADFVLAPLLGETSCREDIYPFNQTVICDLKVNMFVRYRPLGCPITHFAKILDLNGGILTIHLVGPMHRLDKESDIVFKDIGMCMVAAFLGRIVKGRIPAVCETIKFLPEHCMMQKVHAGVVVYIEKDVVKIEGIDLKVPR